MSSFDKYHRPNISFNMDDEQWQRITKGIRLVFVALVAITLLFLLITMFYRIDASDEGVVLRFGKKVETVQPGLHWKLPWPIDSVYKVPVQRIQTLEFGFQTVQPGKVTSRAPKSSAQLGVSEMLTGDLNLGNVEWIVQYRIKDSTNYLFKIGSTEEAWWSPSTSAVPDTIRDISESAMRKLVGDSSIDYVLTIGRDQIAKDAEILIQEELDSFEAGVDIVTVKLQTTSPPTAEVQDAFQEVNRARQKKERVVNEALGERNSKIPAARGAKEKAIFEAEGYQNRVVLETTGQINAFLAQLAEYEKAPEVTRKRLYLEAMEEILAAISSKTIIDESVRGILPLLNLDSGAPAGSDLQGVKR
jgi:membrane protease subunit HflK